MLYKPPVKLTVGRIVLQMVLVGTLEVGRASMGIMAALGISLEFRLSSLESRLVVRQTKC
jgi:hypothetical protein